MSSRQVIRSRRQGSAEEDTSLASGIRIAMLVAGIALLVLAGVLWWPAPPATVKNTRVTTVVRPPTAKAARDRSDEEDPAQQKGSRRTITTTQVLNGRSDQAGDAQPAGSSSRRSETISVSLIAGALLLCLLAGVGRLPSKLSFAGTGVEYPASLTPSEVQTLSAKVGERATQKVLGDPRKLGTAIAQAYDDAVIEKTRRAVGAPPEAGSWGAELADAYFDELADKAVRDAEQGT